MKKNNHDFEITNSFFLGEKKKWNDHILEMRQVTKVSKGGKKIRFRLLVVIGNYLNCIGIGIGKDKDMLNAVAKGIQKAQKNCLKIFITKNKTIPYSIIGKFKASTVLLKPINAEIGIIAGNTLKLIFEFIGIKNIITKQFGSNNIINITKATFSALKNFIQ